VSGLGFEQGECTVEAGKCGDLALHTLRPSDASGHRSSPFGPGPAARIERRDAQGRGDSLLISKQAAQQQYGT